jgi:hypothetical protein
MIDKSIKLTKGSILLHCKRYYWMVTEVLFLENKFTIKSLNTDAYKAGIIQFSLESSISEDVLITKLFDNSNWELVKLADDYDTPKSFNRLSFL